MADMNSSLPVRTEANGDVVVQVSDGTTPSQKLAVDASGKIIAKLDDGAGNAVTSQASGAQRALDVGINVAGVQVDPRAVRALTSADVVTAAQATAANLNATVVGTGTFATQVTSLPSIPAGSNAIGSVLANLQVASAAVSVSNPVPVSISSSIPGTAVSDYNTAAAVASLGTSNHDYIVTALKSLNLARIHASASGKIKIEVQLETAAASGVFNTKYVAFSSTASPNIDLKIESPLVQVTGAKVRVIRTNLDKNAEDLYSTIEGTEV